MDKQQCVRCHQTKVKIKLRAKGSYRYEDMEGNYWNGKTCPDCFKEVKRINIRKQREAKRVDYTDI